MSTYNEIYSQVERLSAEEQLRLLEELAMLVRRRVTSDIAADKLMRSRSNRVLYGAPPPYKGIGRPRIHGNKFKLNDPTTWWTPNEVLDILDPKLGQLRIHLWHDLHD